MLRLSLTSLFKGYYKYCQCGCKILIKCVNNGRFIRYKKEHNPHFNNNKSNQGEYIIIRRPYYPYCDKNGYVRQHRYIMYIYLSILNNKPTYIEGFDVHHKNKDRKDNRIENLELITRPDHQSLHRTKDKSGRYCNICKSKTTTKTLKNGKYYENWYGDIDGFLCMNCKKSLEHFKNKFSNS